MEKQDIAYMLEDVRKAHRLIYQYQKCILSTIKEIHKEYDFPQYPTARKLFSNPLKSTEQFYENKAAQKKGNGVDIKFQKNPEANLSIEDKWAWDFLYTYELEYYFGLKNKNKRCLFSVFQVSDTGYYWRDGYQLENGLGRASKIKPELFWNATESQSYLIFAAEVSTDIKPKYFPNVKRYIEVLYGGENDCLVLADEGRDGTVLVAQRYPMDKFFDKEGSLQCIEHFSALVDHKTDFVLQDNV